MGEMQEFWMWHRDIEAGVLTDHLGFDPTYEPQGHRHCKVGPVLTVNVPLNQKKQYGLKCPKCNRWVPFDNGNYWLSEFDVGQIEEFASEGMGAEWVWGAGGDPSLWKHGGPSFEHTPKHDKEPVTCTVKDCTNASWNTGIENHHFAPRAVFKESADSWPVKPLCIPHHDEWHKSMNGYKYEPYMPDQELGGESG